MLALFIDIGNYVKNLEKYEALTAEYSGLNVSYQATKDFPIFFYLL